MLSGNVLVTGGAGFLARAIYRRARAENWPARFTCMSRDDAKHAALQKRFPEVECVVADVGLVDVPRLTDLMRGFDTVIHAAAWKYVDRGEGQARATIETNVIGSLNVAEAARRARVERVVGISTDKATQPVNNYGATKFLMERIFQEADEGLGGTRFNLCRYGNVAGSTGSVIPNFMAAAAEGRMIHLTDPGMTRFWMSPDEAVDTVLHALSAPRGSVTVPACRSMSMHDLTLMALGASEHGPLEPYIERGLVDIVGMRPGEKRHEALVHRQESIRAERAREWVYIYPPIAAPMNVVEFEITSDKPQNGWMGVEEMRAIVADAGTV